MHTGIQWESFFNALVRLNVQGNFSIKGKNCRNCMTQLHEYNGLSFTAAQKSHYSETAQIYWWNALAKPNINWFMSDHISVCEREMKPLIEHSLLKFSRVMYLLR